jgi:hypothetical protein
MDILSLAAGIVIGFILGAGALIFYMRWKMTKQLNAMQQDMQGMFDATEDMMGSMDDMGDIEDLEEDKEKEEK